MTNALKAALLCIASLAASACTNVDCPLDNIVEMTCGLYSAEDKASLKISDTLTVRAGGTKDTILLNRAQNISSFALPLRHQAEEDTLLLRFSNAAGLAATDTLFVGHTNMPHFESVDCPSAMFHTLNCVRWTSHTLSQMPLTIDSVSITRNAVNYENIENLRIYLRSVVVQ